VFIRRWRLLSTGTSAMTSSIQHAQLPGLHNPITHAGRVVYNAKRDFIETRKRKHKRGCTAIYEHSPEFGPPECHSIQQYELCMRNHANGYLVWSPNDTDVSVFSCANGMATSNAKLEDVLRKPHMATYDVRGAAAESYVPNARVRHKRDSIEFAGVASNRAIYDERNSANEEALAVQVGGLQTIYNTGGNDICTGHVVLWDMPWLSERQEPMRRYAGIPRKKKLFSTIAYKPDLVNEEIARIARAEGGVDEMAVVWDFQRRVIGKALSSAKPGEPFDILLGHYCI
jgi:hypothetical protein